MPSYMLSVENRELKGGGAELKSMIWDAAVDSVREWTGQDLTTSSLYGIRVYKEGAVLAPHVDRLPLVSSAIINVAQDVDEPWPLEVYTHDGIARNITMEVRRSSAKNLYPFFCFVEMFPSPLPLAQCSHRLSNVLQKISCSPVTWYFMRVTLWYMAVHSP